MASTGHSAAQAPQQMHSSEIWYATRYLRVCLFGFIIRNRTHKSKGESGAPARKKGKAARSCAQGKQDV